MRLLLQPGGPLHTPEDGSGDDGCGRAAGSAGAPGDGGCVRGVEEDGGASLSAEHDGTRVSGGGGKDTKVEEGRKQRQGTLHFLEGWGSGSRGKRAWKEDTPAEAGESKQTQELLKCLVKMSVRHEQELMRIRPDVGFIAFCDTSELGCVAMLQEVLKTWQQQFQQGQVKTALKTILAMSMVKDLRERAEAVLRDEEQMKRCHNVGWAVETESALDPAWIYTIRRGTPRRRSRCAPRPLRSSTRRRSAW